MTSQLIGSGLSDHPSSPVRTKVECCKSHDLFGCQIKDCSATRIPSLSITGRHPRPTGSLMGVGGYPSAEVQSVYSTAPVDWAIILVEQNVSAIHVNKGDLLLVDLCVVSSLYYHFFVIRAEQDYIDWTHDSSRPRKYLVKLQPKVRSLYPLKHSLEDWDKSSMI